MNERPAAPAAEAVPTLADAPADPRAPRVPRAPRRVRPAEAPPVPGGRVGLVRPSTTPNPPRCPPPTPTHWTTWSRTPCWTAPGTGPAPAGRVRTGRLRAPPGRTAADALLTARFGGGDRALVLVAVATGARAAPGAHRAAAEACRWMGEAVGLSHSRLAEDIRAARRGELKSGLHRLTDRTLGRLRAGAAEQGLAPEAYGATLRCLLLPADPECRIRVFFGVGTGGLFRLRDGAWQDIEPKAAEARERP
ncbi:protein phosphatase 2C domain-containing protein [Streptomyces sp. INA 01156]